MTILRSPRRLQQTTSRLRRRGITIGFVPTMGALHEGHLRLIRAARRQTRYVVVSIFVNPLQFNQRADYTRYPRPRAQDLALLRRAGADLVFIPSATQLYPADFQTTVEVTRLTRRWDGPRRPGHFRGVATVVTTLFHLVQPDVAYFGDKDAQQVRVIQQLVRDLHWPVRIVVCPTVREPGGLAMSSRNQRLSPSEKREALVVNRALQAARRLIECGERRRAVILRRMRQVVREAPRARWEYAAIVNPTTLEPAARITGRVRLLIAVWVGGVRLIDAMLVNSPRH